MSFVNSNYESLQKSIEHLTLSKGSSSFVLFKQILKEIFLFYFFMDIDFMISCGIIYCNNIIGVNFTKFFNLIPIKLDEKTCELHSKSQISQYLLQIGYHKKLVTQSLCINNTDIYNRVNNREWAFFTSQNEDDEDDDESFSRRSEIPIPSRY